MSGDGGETRERHYIYTHSADLSMCFVAQRGIFRVPYVTLLVSFRTEYYGKPSRVINRNLRTRKN